MRTLLALLTLLVLPGCFTEGYSMKDRWMEAQQKYNNGVRWSKLEDAIPYLPKDDQHPFVEHMTALEDELEFDGSELTQYDLDKKHDKVKARMTYTWTLKRHGLLEKTVTEQTWTEQHGKWTMLHEVRLRGGKLPLWKEREDVADEVKDEEAKDASKPDESAKWKYGATAGGPGPGTN
ncbi:MAG: hypothetical protein ABI321_03220 [Polyangia bacterium]